MAPHPLTNFEIQNYYQNEPRFNGVYSRPVYLLIMRVDISKKKMKINT